MRVSAVYYGWLVLAAAALSELLVMGATAYSAGLFVLPLQAEFHISRASANSSIIILYVGAAIVSPFIGRLLDRYSVRLVVCCAAVILGAAFATIAKTSSLLLMGLMLLFPAAVGFVALGPLTTQTLATRWFRLHRGLALGLAAVATSGGGFIVVPLLNNAIQHYGWRLGLLYEAMILGAIIIALALFILRDRPSDLGLQGHRENTLDAPETDSNEFPSSSLENPRFYSSSSFWVPTLVLACVSGTSQATVITFVPYAIQLGFDANRAALLVSVFAASAAATKIIAGFLSDRIDQRILLAVACLSMTFSWLILCLSQFYAALLGSSSLAGMALGCALPTTAGLIAARFGQANFGSIMGWTLGLTAALAIVSVLFVGSIYDHVGAYHMAFETFFLLLASMLIAAFWFARGPRSVRVAQ